MWAFKGKYTGEAKTYIEKKNKKDFIITSLIFSIIVFCIGLWMTIGFFGDKSTSILIGIMVTLASIALIVFLLFLDYRRAPKCEIKINNDGFQVYNFGHFVSIVFYNVLSIDKYDDFIVIKSKNNKAGFVLQKELLIEGNWEELKVFLEKVEESLKTEDPVYQIEEPTTEFFNATVKSKRICKKFVGEVRMPHATYEYFVTFSFENGNEIEYQVCQELYEAIDQGQTGTLVLVNGSFFDFGDGEDVEEE